MAENRGNPILRLDKLCKSFGGVVTAKDVSFSVYPGEIKGLIGPNGAGKTTMMNMISGIYTADSGDIYFDEKKITDQPDYMRARMGIGRTFQTPRFLQRSSIRDNLMIGADLGNKIGYLGGFFGKSSKNFNEELDEMMSLLHFNFDWDDDINSLPFGQRKLLEIVRSLLSHPKIIMVDEPAAGLNNKEIEYLTDILRMAASKGIGVLLIEHSMDMIMDICQSIVVLCFGVLIAEGTPEEIANNNAVIEAYLGREDDD